jgi:nucleotide-binding universal stress UspA family protein
VELTVLKAEREYLKGVTKRLDGRTAQALSSAVLKGKVARTLQRYVSDSGADLVVMTTHGRGGLRRLWLGSVADQLVRTLEVPVLLIRAREDGAVPEPVDLGEILVPLDGSPLAEAALEPAAALARLWDAEVSLVQVVPPAIPAADPALPVPAGYNNRLTTMRRELAEDYIHDMAEHLRTRGVKASGIAVIGAGTADTLLDLARAGRVGLVALATQGRGGVRRLVLGSVADKLVRAAEVPILVVRPGGRRGRGPRTRNSRARRRSYNIAPIDAEEPHAHGAVGPRRSPQ